MRPAKGGIWKNTEDEILKAAVMKYGKNEWARISSLLNRKSPKQCKARWYEWLDPAVKKVEWTRDEDEKLLHLAKLMPMQWRTIAPVVGRTANQCLERYQKLLDEAESSVNTATATTTTTTTAGPSTVSHEFDPETKPARPDPIDMDEDEKEMLSEARARLLNTQGKKAKRKARERLLEASRRTAYIEKRRELLDERGIKIGLKSKRKKEMDYNREVPFYTPAQAGFYDVEEEKQRPKPPVEFKAPLPPSKQQKKDDADKNKKPKKADTDSAARLVKLQDQELFTKRRRLNLPDPQIGDQQVQELVKLTQTGQSARDSLDATADTATHLLTADTDTTTRETVRRFTDRVHSTALVNSGMTPRVEDVIRAEAHNLRVLSSAPTPLIGGQTEELRHGGTGFEGATPQTHFVRGRVTPAVTGRDGSSTDVTVASRTPAIGMGTVRDDLNINPADEEEDQVDDQAKQQLDFGFSSLPKPKNEFEIVLPDEEGDDLIVHRDGDGDVVMEMEDQADVEARQRRQRQKEELKRLERRSEVLKRGLPVPTHAHFPSLESSTDGVGKRVEEEYRKLVALDVEELELQSADDDTDLIKRARELVNAEVAKMLHGRNLDSELDKMDDARAKLYAQMYYSTSPENSNALTVEIDTTRRDKVSTGKILKSLQCEFQSVKRGLDKVAQQASSLHHQLTDTTPSTDTAGAAIMELHHHLESRRDQISTAYEKLDALTADFEVVQKMHYLEVNVAFPMRKAKWVEDIAKMNQKEEQAQKRCGEVRAKLKVKGSRKS